MGYIDSVLLPVLKHTIPDTFLDVMVLKHCLWYSTSSQAYIQRTNKFDGSWLGSSTSDDFVALRIQKAFNVPVFKVFDKVGDCHAAVDLLDAGVFDSDLLYIARDKSLFINFWEKMRNSLAHGGFNIYNEKGFAINQHKPKPDGQVSFLLQTCCNVNEALSELWYDFEEALTDSVAFKYGCLEEVLNLRQEGEFFFSETKDCLIIIDDDFKFTSPQHVMEVKQLLLKYRSDVKTDIIVSENLGSIAEKNLTSVDGMIRVVPQSKIAEYYQMTNIIKVPSSKCTE